MNNLDRGFAGHGMSATTRQELEAEIASNEMADAIDAALTREFQPNRKEPKMANVTSGSMVGKDYNQTGRPSIADTLENAVAALSNAANELTGITDILCGSQPQEGAAKIRGVADGHFQQIDMSARDIETITETILSNTGRIRGRL